MGEHIELLARDGHRLGAYHAVPSGERRGGLVLVQEIFGVNGHIRDVADRFAAAGLEVVAPQLFDRLQRDVELGYDDAGTAEGRRLRTTLGWDLPLLDLEAAAERLGPSPGIVGFCWGGSLAFLAACRLSLGAAVGYYGAQIIQFKDEAPRCPVLLHFGERDPLIPAADVEAIRAAQPAVKVHVYAAGHGFNCDQRRDFEPEVAKVAWARTLEHFERLKQPER